MRTNIILILQTPIAEYILYFSAASAREASNEKDILSRVGWRIWCINCSIRSTTSAVSSRQTGSDVVADPSIGNSSESEYVSRFRWCAPKSSPSDDFNVVSMVNLQNLTENIRE